MTRRWKNQKLLYFLWIDFFFFFLDFCNEKYKPFLKLPPGVEPSWGRALRDPSPRVPSRPRALGIVTPAPTTRPQGLRLHKEEKNRIYIY